MNPLGVLGALIAGIIFGLLVAWGTVGLVIAMIGVAVLVVGSFIGMFKVYCGAATLGFLFAFVIAGGLALIGF